MTNRQRCRWDTKFAPIFSARPAGIKNESSFLPASLTENFPSKVYVIHEMHLDDDFSIRRKHGRKITSFCVIFTQSSNPFLFSFTVCHFTGMARVLACHAHKMHIPDRQIDVWGDVLYSPPTKSKSWKTQANEPQPPNAKLTPPPLRRTLATTMPAGFDATFATVKKIVVDFRANEKFYLSPAFLLINRNTS